MNSRDQRRLQFGLVLAASLFFSTWHSEFTISLLSNPGGWTHFQEILSGFASPDSSQEFLLHIGDLAIESFLIGILGTGLAILLAIGLAIFAAHIPDLEAPPGQSRGGKPWLVILRSSVRSILALFRSIPEIVWAFLFVRIFGLGPAPAVFAIAITFAGIIGKLFAELIEAADPTHARHLRAAGAGTVAVFVFGILPLVRRQFVAYALFRFECGIRSASILGVVGAGGLGQEIDLSIRYFQYDKLATALLAVLTYVMILEIAGTFLRKVRPVWPIVGLFMGCLLALGMLDIPWHELRDSQSVSQAGYFLAGFAQPTVEWGFIIHATQLVFVTISMAWLATFLAALIAFVLAPMAATTFTLRGYLDNPPQGQGWSRWLFLVVLIPARLSLQVSRSIPDLVWALLFVVWVGPGVTAGILALTVHTVGILGRLFSDVFEDAEPGLPRTLEARGVTPLGRYLYGVLPQIFPSLLAFTLFRFEVNVRAAAMMGFVGGGGLGDALHTAISLFHMNDLATLLIISFLLVVFVDAAGSRVRLSLIQKQENVT